ncbi:hypothetical protein DCAR_0206791 [Daucus carota subsp. sativus]|uniref:RBR-type E3 ubiquitin transferase n=1 Tax=Daucus carota subsp. sativus TaxID=79200 RepID=A0AAF0WCS3_DAUCS|nr:PREDICTED: uncharacterized protein LOC108206766 [Daucus carota subsp. sativus]WOG87562.1 hypothetical protein DCAR_0206791 [Daucus carota subsp. sativus]
MSALKPSNPDVAGETSAMIRPEPFESDDDFAFRLQLLEAMTASMSFQPSSSTQSSSNAAVSSSSQTLALHQEILDLNLAHQEAKKSLDDYNRWIDDRKLAEQLQNQSEGEWDDLESFSEIGESSEGGRDEIFRVYFKGLLANDENYDSKGKSCVSKGKNCVLKPKVAGIGVAICDESDRLLLEISKPEKVMEGEWMNNRVVAARALIEGLSAALNLGLKNVVFFCDYFALHQMVTGRWSAKQDKLAVLLNKVKSLRKRFTTCRPSFVARNEVKFAFKLAREAIVSLTTKHAESSGAKLESCSICLEDVEICQIFSVDGCMHRYCFSCMKQHVEVKLLNAIQPKCPHDGCASVLTLDSCQKFLTPKLAKIMSERLAEEAIPVTEKIYCPYPRCSALMSRTDSLEYTKTLYPYVQDSGVRKCMQCHRLFCANCKVPWHNNMSCYVFKKNNFNQHGEDVKLKTLAAQNLWRQCVKCSHMIELAKGCYHMTCRCGYEFCYTCGSEWKNKRATCTCPLWDDDNIMDDDFDDDYDAFEEVDFFDSDDEDDYF